MEHWYDLLPQGRILDVRCEEVVADLEVQARRILAHCELRWDPHCLAFHESDRPVRTASAAQVRRPLHRSAVEWSRIYHAFLRPPRAALESFSVGDLKHCSRSFPHRNGASCKYRRDASQFPQFRES
jgi:hypothetical protein